MRGLHSGFGDNAQLPASLCGISEQNLEQVAAPPYTEQTLIVSLLGLKASILDVEKIHIED
jgi:hypothetical protein